MAIAPTPTPATTKRSVRAATEFLAIAEVAPELYEVNNDEGDCYMVNMREPACTCGDYQYRADSNERVSEHGCKHIRRVRMERGEIDVTPLLATDLRIDPLLLENLDDDSRRILADGGCPEHLTRISTLTGEDVVHCQTCGGEGDGLGTVDHHDDCPDG